MSTALPLRRIRVLDLGQYISGPCAGVLLAELGADVVKIEPPAGDPFRKWESGGLNATFVAFNRGKQSVVLDLKAEPDRGRLLDLVRRTDVLIENFRPGVMDRLGLGYGRLRRYNEALVYCSVTGFGAGGPHAAMPAYDGVALGYSGMAGLLLDPDDPRVRGPALADAITGHTAALNILAALLARGESGGQRLEVSMFGALVHFLHSAVAKKIVEGCEEGPYLRPHSSGVFVFNAADGRALIIHLSSPPKFWECLCRAIGRPELIEDPRFRQRSDRQANYENLRAELTPTFLGRGRDEWLAVLQAGQVPCAPVNTVGEALEDDQMRYLGLVDTFEEAGIGPMPRIRPPAWWDGVPLPAVGRAPFLGEHTDAVLAAAALAAEQQR